ncbi:NAD(P)-binding domain-containing protein [Spongiactinospora sp. TRM90649]|uniref:NAD(P)-dependent oxidoreductase n=1 Tax=Spongiactinospora sp. TRM90649 TaxID=3031114 RepID=UPI0023F92215|nr:NAD(P)-binding domain-containing protein [Spongiactinospora sp. TRM90649]MDF5757401.1 NAD(P)-binding domain-containing protein [Spongiactinospora sp. TRM90649]
MTGTNATPVTVVGLGSMGAALAEAYVRAGHPTTVWNRTAAKAAPLVGLGARHTEDVAVAVAASPLVITCLTTFDDTRSALRPAAAALRGRALVTLNSGSPAGARETAAWAAELGARFLAGAVKNVPAAVGAPETLLYYSGDRAVFEEHEAALRVLGGDTVHLGEESDLAALYEMAVGAMLLPALAGFFQGAAAIQARGLKASTMVRFAGKWLDMIKSLLPVYAKEIDSGDYTDAASSVNLFMAAEGHDADLAEEANVDTSWLTPVHDLVRRAAAAGHGEHSIAALTEVFKVPGGDGPAQR